MQAAAQELTDDPASPDPQHRVLWLVLGTAAYFVLGLLGRLTIADGEVLSLVWPAAGAAMLLFGLTPVRSWPGVSVVFAVATLALNLITGATLALAVVFAVANVTQAIVGVLILRRLSPGLRGAGGTRPLDHLRDFWSVLAASVVAALVGAALGALGRGLFLDVWSTRDLWVWWGRNATGCVVVFTTAVLAIDAWVRLQQPSERERASTLVRTRAMEGALLAGFTTALYVLVFLGSPALPVAFPLLVPTVWAGLRFEPLTVALHSLAVCLGVVVFTLMEHGAFAELESWADEVLVSQLFIALVFCLGTLLSLGRGERLALTHTLTTARADSESQADVLSAIIDTMHDGLTVIDETGQVLRRNPAGAQMVRTESDRHNHVRDSHFTMHATDGRLLEAADYPWVRAIAGDNVVDQDIVLSFHDGSPTRTLAVSARRLPGKDARGRARAVVIYHDVTTDRAQRSALESFAQVVAHDLRGPLAIVEGWTEVLVADLVAQDSLPAAEVGPKLERIRIAAKGMQQLIGDLLESSISREQRLRLTVIDLASLAQSVADQRTAVAVATPPRIHVDALPDVHGDAALVRQLLDNLIGNAVKYVVPGQTALVSVTGRSVGDQVEVTVADEGIGIPAAERDRIFEAFHRAHGGADYDGHGIGLAVCKQIVERHGGRIAARAPLGDVGTRIVFTLPAVPVG